MAADYRISALIQTIAVFSMFVLLLGSAGLLLIFKLSSNRQIQSYGVVIDAGSTQTRSSLFKVTMLHKYQDNDGREARQLDLSQVLDIEQVSSCTNGGPISALASMQEAGHLLSHCMSKFMSDIDEDMKQAANSERTWGSIDAPSQSVSHIFVGATAGMRALEVLNPIRAHQIMQQFRGAIHKFHYDYIYNIENVDIISGPQEALYGWLTVNYMCHKLETPAAPQLATTKLIDDRQDILQATTIKSIGTVELGGASAQMAYEILTPPSRPIMSASNDEMLMQSPTIGTSDDYLVVYNETLFDHRYQIKARSDLCLGMTQALLRTNIVLLYDHSLNFTFVSDKVESIVIENPCMQMNSTVSLATNLFNKLSSACLKESKTAAAHLGPIWQQLKQSNVIFRGTGQPDRCSPIISKLLDVNICRQYFELCPQAKPIWSPPANIPFVTISGYNKALGVLPLTPVRFHHGYDAMSDNYKQNQQAIESQLGGYSIDYDEFQREVRQFCSINVASFPQKFPAMKSLFYATNCFQLIYIDRILVDYYKFEPTTTWHQIKFLLFPPSDTPPTSGSTSEPIDIGWSLGLLINASNSNVIGTDHIRSDTVRLHHGISLINVIKTSTFFIFATFLIAFAIISLAIMVVHNRRSNGLSVYTTTHHRDPSVFAYSL